MAGIGDRVTRLERAVAPQPQRHPPSGFFLVWGHDHQAIAAAVTASVKHGLINENTVIAEYIWPHDDPAPPPPRWTDLTQISDLELDTLHSIMAQGK